MTSRINKCQRIVQYIRKTIVGLGIRWGGNKGIGGCEAGDARQVVAGVVVDESEVVVVLLAGVAAVGIGLAGGGAVGAEGEVAGAAAGNHAATVIVAHDAIAAEVVAVQVQQVVGLARDDLPHGDGLPGEEVDAAAGDSAGGLDTALPPRPCRVMLLPSPGLRRVELEWDRG